METHSANTILSLRLNGDLCDSRKAIKLASEAEEHGFDFFWYCEDLFKRDAWIILSAVAYSTTDIKLGTAIVNPFSSSVVEIAMRAATLAELSGGRFNLGIGVGAPETLKWAGINVQKPVQGLYEAVKSIRQLLANNGHQNVENRLRFKHAYKVPIYIGGQGRRTIEAIGRIGDGGLPLLVPPESLEKFLPVIMEGARKEGRTHLTIDISGCLWFYVAESEEELKSSINLRQLIAYYGPLLSNELLQTAGLSSQDFSQIAKYMSENEFDKAIDSVTPGMMKLVISSTYDRPEKIIERIKVLRGMGLKHFNVGPPLGEDLSKAVEYIGKLFKQIRLSE